MIAPPLPYSPPRGPGEYGDEDPAWRPRFLSAAAIGHTGSGASTAAEPGMPLTQSDPLPELGNA